MEGLLRDDGERGRRQGGHRLYAGLYTSVRQQGRWGRSAAEELMRASARKEDPTLFRAQGIEFPGKSAGMPGPRSVPIGTPPPPNSLRNIKALRHSCRGPGWMLIYSLRGRLRRIT